MTARPHSRYHSRRCQLCDRDYLFPAYGGRATCNDCLMTHDERPRTWKASA